MTEKKNSVLTLKNYMLVPLATWLNGVQLAGRESRERTRFIVVLSERIEEIGKQRKELQVKYAIKDKVGKVKETITDKGTPNERGLIDFGKNKEKADVEWNEYMDEEYKIDVLEGNKSKVYTVREIILNTEEKFQGVMAIAYNGWAECFEALPDRKEV